MFSNLRWLSSSFVTYMGFDVIECHLYLINYLYIRFVEGGWSVCFPN